MTRIYLTRTGLLATNHKADNSFIGAAFFTNEGRFVRQCSISEAIYLVEEIELQPIKLIIYKDGTDLTDFMYLLLPLPKWEHVISVRVTDDCSSFKSATCNNGGDYSFSETLHWFVCTMPNGKPKFRVVTTYSTSAEFEFDQLSGNFEQGLGKLIVENAPAEFTTMTSRNEDGYIEDHYVMLEKISEPCTFADIWNQQYLYIPSKEDVDNGRDEYTCDALTITRRKEIVSKLRGLGLSRPKAKVRTRKRR